MKKPYISPSTLVVTINHHSHILAGSPGITTSETSASQGSDVLSRSGSFWDDDDEE
jgi:hypothetical protein